MNILITFCWFYSPKVLNITAQKMKFSIKDFMTEAVIIQKPVHWFAEQINGLRVYGIPHVYGISACIRNSAWFSTQFF